MATEKKEMIVGGGVVAVLLASLLLSYGGRDLAEKSEAGSYVVNATFNRVDGLLEGDEVRVGGIRVGSVSAMVLDSYFRADLALKVDDAVRLPTDTSAAIHTSGLFGSKYVVLEPGGDETYYKDGDKITFTQDATIVTELMDLIIAEGRARTAKGSNDKKDQ